MEAMLVGYALVMVLVALAFRHHQSGDEYLMAGRSVGSAQVGAGIFTLIGGGELVTLTALAYVYGFAALSLFVGYALAFLFLAAAAPRIRSESDALRALSLPDFAHARFGKATGWVVFFITFAAFFALLLLQVVAGGQVLSVVLDSTYSFAVLAVAGLIFVYLFIGGLKTVFATDLIQAVAMLLLLPILLLTSTRAVTDLNLWGGESPPLFLIVSLIATGFLVGSASADVWQRIYAAKSVGSARKGLVGGAFLLMIYGVLLVLVGVAARGLPGISGPDTAFVEVVTGLGSDFTGILAVLLVLSAVTSTADTELFLLAGLGSRQWLRLTKRREGTELASAETTSLGRWTMAIIAVAAVLLALLFDDLVGIYSWLLMAVLVISPGVIAAVLSDVSPRLVATTFWLNGILFIAGLVTGFLNLDNAFIVATPGLVLVATLGPFSGSRRS